MKKWKIPAAFIDLPKDAQFQMMIINYLRKNHKQDFITNAKLTAQATRAAIQAILFLDDLLALTDE